MSHGPIQPDLHGTMNALAEALKKLLEPYGFALLVFPMSTPKGRMNYISNAKRADMLVAMKEFIANNEGRVLPEPTSKQ